jgi:hypothetical protein
MNKVRFRGWIFSLSALILLTIFTFRGIFGHMGKTPFVNTQNKAKFTEKKVTIIPIIVIGGLQFFRKAFEKK